MIYVISKSTFGSYNVRDIQCNANWDCCPYSDYALIPDGLVEGILATKGYCDITLNSAGTEVVSFTARTIPSVPDECCGDNTVLSVNGVKANKDGALTLSASDVGALQLAKVADLVDANLDYYYGAEKSGRYWCNNTVESGKSTPFYGFFHLEVSGSLQRATAHPSGRIRVRSRINEVWSKWSPYTESVIISQGKSGDWYYRKWSDGFAECWRDITGTTNVTDSWGGIYTSGSSANIRANYPFTFDSKPTVLFSPEFVSNSSYWIVAKSAGTTTTTPNIQIARGTSSEDCTYDVHVYAYGISTT